MEVEHVTRVGLTTGRAAEQERELAVGDGLLAEVIVNEQRVLGHGLAVGERLARLLACPHEVLAHRAAGVGRDVLHRGGVGAARGDDDGVVHRALLFERLHHAGNGRLFLADGDVDADHGFIRAPVLLLVDDRVHRNSGLTCLAVTDDQLTLAATDRDHRVDRLDTGLQRLGHRLTLGDAGRDDVDESALGGVDRGPAVDRAAERVDHAAEHGFTDGHLQQLAGALDDVAFLY